MNLGDWENVDMEEGQEQIKVIEKELAHIDVQVNEILGLAKECPLR